MEGIILLWFGTTVGDKIEAGTSVERQTVCGKAGISTPMVEERSSGYSQGLLKNRSCFNHQHTLVFVVMVVVEERGFGG